MYKSESKHESGIYARVVEDSTANSIRLTTLELKFHRFILPEFNTHRMFSRNAASSRAIPVKKVLQQVEDNPAMPAHWGKNQPGMQASEEHNAPIDFLDDGTDYCTREYAWIDAAESAATTAYLFDKAGYHKQIVNRLVEPFQFVKVVVTATEFENFFKLRLHEDAQPEIQVLAQCMKQAMDDSEPVEMIPGLMESRHLPYVDLLDFTHEHSGGSIIDYEAATRCSVARCARVSFLNHDKSNPDQEKDQKLYDQLLEAGHMSPFEHVAAPMEEINTIFLADGFPTGSTHMDRQGDFWSGNFRGWAQYRQLLNE